MCDVDSAAIQSYYKKKTAWSFLPFLGPIIGNYASGRISDEHQKELDTETGKLTGQISQWRTEITALAVGNTDDINSLTQLTQSYTDATVGLAFETINESVGTLTINGIFLVLVVALILFKVASFSRMVQ